MPSFDEMTKDEAMRSIAEDVADLAKRLPEAVRSDHPLMGETFGELAQAIRDAGEDIREGLQAVAEAIKQATAGVRR
jgi:hypothetical protein